jgi:hypothetical protein
MDIDKLMGTQYPVGAALARTPPIYRPACQADKSAVDSINRVPTSNH